MVITSAGILSAHILGFYSFGVFLRPITMDLGWDRGAISAAFALCIVISGLLGIFTGRLADKHGPRILVTANGILTGAAFLLLSRMTSLWQAYLIWGLLMSAAGSCCLIPIVSTIPRWFAKREGLAMGLTWTGIGFGGMIGPLLAQWLISNYDWRYAYMVFGIVNLVIVTLLAQFLKRNPQQIGIRPYGDTGIKKEEGTPAPATEGYSFKEATRTGPFWMFGSILFCFIFVHNIMMTHIPAHVADIGISEAIAASIISIFAATSLIGRNLGGFSSDKVGTRLTLSTCLFMLTIMLVWLIFSEHAWMFYLFALLYGVAYGGMIPLQTVMARELFGLNALGMIFAGLMLFGTLGGALGAPLAGYIFDVTRSYHIAFIICLIISGLALILSLIILRTHGKSRREAIKQGIITDN